MSNLIHCDGPDCNNTEPDERRLCDAPWLRVERRGVEPSLDFCSRDCLATWSKPPVVDDKQCLCDGSQLDPHTVTQHRPRPGGHIAVVDGR